VCALGKPLVPTSCFGNGCTPATGDCVGQICAQLPQCCCNTWDEACIALVPFTCNIVCSVMTGDPFDPMNP
jgi:hypothetical protein